MLSPRFLTSLLALILAGHWHSHFAEGHQVLSSKAALDRMAGDETQEQKQLHGASNALPEKVLLGYANWCECDNKIVEAVENGVNVVVWFNTNLKKSEKDSKPFVESCTDLKCVGKVAQTLRVKQLPTVHLMSIGGWNSPHPNTEFSGSEWFEAWNKWNRETAAQPEYGFNGFDGIDWDIEGNDNATSPFNKISLETMDLVGEMSQAAKRTGYIVAMAPAQSYLTVASKDYSLELTHQPVAQWQQLDFPYHGRNTYAYLLAKYGSQTFDLVTVQLYEGWSTANYNITQLDQRPSSYVSKLVSKMHTGWEVAFPRLGSQLVSVENTKVIIGLANGWAKESSGKFLFVGGQDLRKAYTQPPSESAKPRGFGFWNIGDEGKSDIFLTKQLNSFLNTRSD